MKIIDNEEVEFRLEVPDGVDGTTGEYYYTKPTRSPDVIFHHNLILDTRARLGDEAGVIGREILAVAYTMDDAFYAYYKTVRGFDDPVSVRQDKPNVSNIEGGIGVFGANVADSLRTIYVGT